MKIPFGLSSRPYRRKPRAIITPEKIVYRQQIRVMAVDDPYLQTKQFVQAVARLVEL